MNQLTYRILIILGGILIGAAIILFGYSLINDYFASRRADKLLEQVNEQMPEALPEALPPDDSKGPGEEFSAGPVEFYHAESGYSTIGIISIPKLNVTLPVINICTNAALKISACWYSGEIAKEPTQLIISAHNYRNHFGRLNQLKTGDKVSFQINTGMVYNYTVTELLEIDEHDHDSLENGDWDMSLFTCTKDRARRVVVRLVLD